MGLVLTIRQGEDFFVDNDQFFLEKIISEDEVRIFRPKDGKKITASTKDMTDIQDDVSVQVADRITSKAARLVIEAPRTKLILTGVKFRTPRT